MTSIRRAAALPIAILAALAAATPAAAATYSDAPGDSTDGDPGHDITQVDYSFDPASGAVSGTITVAGTASSDAIVSIGVGTREADGTCGVSAAMILNGTLSNNGAVQYVTFIGGQRSAPSPGEREDGQVTTTYRATSAALMGKALNCGSAQVLDANGGAIDSADEPAAAAPTPTPTPSPTTPAPQPTPVAPTPTPAPAAPKAKLRLAVKGVPKRVKVGGLRPKLTVRNAGNKASGKVTVSLKGAKGVSIRPGKVTIKQLKPGKSVTLKLRVSVSRRAKASSAFTVTAAGKGLKRSATVALRRTSPKPKPTPAPKGGLADTFWWWDDEDGFPGWNLKGLRFYANGFAFFGLAEDAPAICTAETAQRDKDGDLQPGCVRWSLKGSALTAGDTKGTYKGGKLTITTSENKDPIGASRLTKPKPGARLEQNLLHRDASGFCGPYLYCTTSTDTLILQKDGQFAKGSSSLTTGGDAGSPAGFVAVGSYPPDARGTYEVLKGYRIRLNFADGTTKTFNFGLVNRDAKYVPDEGPAGVVLGEYNYYYEKPDDD